MKRITFVRGALVCAAIAAVTVGLVQFASSRTLSDEERRAAEKDIYRVGVPLAVARARGRPGLEEWEDAVEKFPTLDSCLVSDRAGKDSLTVDWWKISSDVEASVCLSRVATKLRSLERIMSWSEQHGFTVYRRHIRLDRNYLPEAREEWGTAMPIGWPTTNKGALYKGGLLTWAVQQYGWVYGVSCVFFIGEDRIVFSAHCTSTTL
jgi:hypothetical protein